jgi:transcriptional regulator with XRE-family HTH domain
MQPRIREYRKRLGLTQQEFAAKVGVHLSVIKAWETGRGGFEALNKVQSIADALGIHPLALLSREAETWLLNDPVPRAEHIHNVVQECARKAIALDQAEQLRMPPEELANLIARFVVSRLTDERPEPTTGDPSDLPKDVENET